MIRKYDVVTGHSAMQDATGYSASIVAQMILRGDIDKFGVIKQEDINPDKFIDEWSKRGLVLECYETPIHL